MQKEPPEAHSREWAQDGVLQLTDLEGRGEGLGQVLQGGSREEFMHRRGCKIRVVAVRVRTRAGREAGIVAIGGQGFQTGIVAIGGQRPGSGIVAIRVRPVAIRMRGLQHRNQDGYRRGGFTAQNKVQNNADNDEDSHHY